MTNFKKLIADDVESRAALHVIKTYDCDKFEAKEIEWMSIADYKAGAQRYANLLEKALKALEFECGNRCAIGLNECNARETITEITAELTNKDNK